jgi:hypothetical protein
MARKYDWGDGKGRKHSISLKQHRKNVRARQNDPARFTAPRGALDVQRDADASANLRYGGAERALTTQSQQVPAWFDMHRAQVAGIAQGVQQGYQKAVQEVGAQQQQTAQSDTNARNSLASTMQQDAASRGGSIDPSLFAQDVNAANVRNTNQAAFANLLSSQGAATGGYFGGLQAASGAAQLGQMTLIGQEQQGLAADKSLYKSQYVTDARGDERQYGLEQSAFGLDVAKAEADTSTDRAKLRADRKKRRASQRDRDEDQGLQRKRFRSEREKDAYQRKNKLGPYKPAASKDGLTPVQRRAAKEKRNKATTRIVSAEAEWHQRRRTKYDFEDDKGPRRPTRQEATDALGKKYSADEVRLALKWKRNEPWNAGDRAAARRLGIRLPKRKKAKPAPTTVLNPFD